MRGGGGVTVNLGEYVIQRNWIHFIQASFNCKCQNAVKHETNSKPIRTDQNRTVLDVLC